MSRAGVVPAAVPGVGRVPPGPRTRSPLGSMPALLRDSPQFLCAMAREYGDVVKYRIANMTWYQVNDPAGIRHVLQEHNPNYIKGELQLRVLQPVAGHGLFTSQGETWLRQRRLMQPTFHRRHIAGWGAMMVATAQALQPRWDAAARSGTPVDMLTAMSGLTSRIATQALFSTAVPVEANAVGRALAELLGQISFRFEVPFYPPLAVPTPRNRRFRAALAVVDRTIYGLIDARAQAGGGGDDLLGLLLAARDAGTGSGMSRQQLRDEVVTLFVAGYETTALALTWTWYLLGRNPDAEARLHAELAAVLGGRAPAVDDLPNLPYTRMVLDEAMRLYPPAWVTNREAVAPDTIGGYAIPAKAVVVVSPYVMHRHPAYWDDPERFDPERFLPERVKARPPYAYFPFGGGPRKCIGESFALTEAHLVLATLAQRYRARVVPGRPVRTQAALTLRPRDGLPMRLDAR